jgi:hypothetical protein
MSAGGGQSKSQSESKSYTPEQRQWLGRALEVYGPQIGQGENVFAGQRVADFSPLQFQSLNQAQGYLGSFQPGQGVPLFGQQMAQTGQPLWGETGQALGDILGGRGGAPQLSMEQANETFNRQYVDPAYRNFSMNTSPLIQEQFAGPGFWSSARAGAVGDAAGDLGSQLEAQRAGHLWSTEQTNRQLQEAAANRQLAGVPLGQQYSQTPFQRALTEFGTQLQSYGADVQGQQFNNLTNMQNRLQEMQDMQSIFGMGSAEQQQQQQQINADIQQFAEENRLTSEEDMSILLALLGMNYSSGSSSSSAWNFGAGVQT